MCPMALQVGRAGIQCTPTSFVALRLCNRTAKREKGHRENRIIFSPGRGCACSHENFRWSTQAPPWFRCRVQGWSWGRGRPLEVQADGAGRWGHRCRKAQRRPPLVSARPTPALPLFWTSPRGSRWDNLREKATCSLLNESPAPRPGPAAQKSRPT